MRPYSGFSDEAMADPTVDCRELISGADFDGGGQEFWLRYIIVRNTGIAGALEVYDQNEGVAVGANLRFVADCPANATTTIEFPAPGVRFVTNLTAGLNAAAGTVAAYNVQAGGYLSGGMA